MKNLSTLFNNKIARANNFSRSGGEVIADTILSLCADADAGRLKALSPEHIKISPDGSVSYSQTDAESPYFSAYESVFENKKADKESGWFTLGLLIYYIVFGRTFFKDNGIDIVCLPERKNSAVSLITAESFLNDNTSLNTADSNALTLYKQAMVKLTFWNRSNRYLGVKHLLDAVHTYTSVATIEFFENQTKVFEAPFSFNEPVLNFKPNTQLKNPENGRIYVTTENIKIDFRPGRHTYRVKVKSTQSTDTGATARAGRFLCIKTPDNKTYNLFEISNTPRMLRLAVTCETAKQYTFFESNSADNQYKALYKIDIPADSNNRNSVLEITYNPSGSCEVCLLNKDCTAKLYNGKGIRFNI